MVHDVLTNMRRRYDVACWVGRDMFEILVIVSVNVINHVILVNILIMKIVSTGKVWEIN